MGSGIVIATLGIFRGACGLGTQDVDGIWKMRHYSATGYEGI